MKHVWYGGEILAEGPDRPSEPELGRLLQEAAASLIRLEVPMPWTTAQECVNFMHRQPRAVSEDVEVNHGIFH